MRNKQSGILYKKKNFLTGGKLSYSFFSYQNLLTNDYIKIYKNVVYIEINCEVKKCSPYMMMFPWVMCVINSNN